MIMYLKEEAVFKSLKWRNASVFETLRKLVCGTGKGQHGNLFGRCASLKSLVFKKDTLCHFIIFFVYVRSKRGSEGLIPENNLRF